MVQVIKKNLDNTDAILINADEGMFYITFAGNLDLYIGYYGEDIRKTDKHSFIVSKDNYFLYRCFDELYDAIICEMPFKNGFVSLDKYPLKHLYYPLINNKVIEWHSDDGLYDEAAILFIEKIDGSYRITVKEGLVSDINIQTSSVRFRNHGSIYDPYNCAFMGLYNQLCAHNFDYEQITMDEYIDRIKIKKR